MFVDREYKVFILFYVNDVLAIYYKDDEKKAQEIISKLNEAYNLRDLKDIEQFLGVRVIRDRTQKKLQLVHNIYLEKVAQKFNLIDKKCLSTPLPIRELSKHEGQAQLSRIKRYQEKVGSVLYTAIITRLDVMYTAALLSQFLTNPGPEYIDVVDQTIRYLFGTRFLSIQYSGEHQEVNLMIVLDASFVDDVETRRSA